MSGFGEVPYGIEPFGGPGLGPTSTPITYSFTVVMVNPVSPEWPCLDMTGVYLPSVFALPQASRNRGAPWVGINGSSELYLFSSDSNVSWFRYALPFQTNFTLEVEFKPSSLPDDLLQLDEHRFFIAAYDKQGSAGGILVSRSGVALVPSFGDSVLALAGSQHIFEEGEEPYTMRITVSSTTNVMNIYVTKSSYLPITGHQLRYTSPVLETPFGVTDRMQLEVCGSALKPVMVKFLNLRAHCTEAVIPNHRPIADAGSDRTANIGSAVIYDGTNSYDPEGAPLTYRWALTDTPDGSRFKICGDDGSTSDDGDTDGFTNIFDGGPDAFSVASAPLLQPGDHLITENEIYVVGTDRWTLDAETNKYVRDPLTWVDSELVITDDVLPDYLSGVAWYVCHSATYFIDTTRPISSAIPDISGLYEARLIVNDGELDSLPASNLLNVSQTSVILGCTPDVSWLWDMLSDFWNLLEDREILETAWSGFAQAAAAQMLTAWQVDYNKSLLDIQRVFQRRWLSYDTFLNDDPETATIRIIRGPILTGVLADWLPVVGKTFQVILDAGAVQTVTFTTTNPVPHVGDLTPAQVAYQINEQLGFASSVNKPATVEVRGGDTYIVLSYALLLRIRPGGTANGDLGLSTTDYLTNDLQGTGGPVAANKLRAFEATTPVVVDFDGEGVAGGDLLVMEGVGYQVQKTATGGLSLVSNLPAVESPTQYPLPWAVPSVVTSTMLDFGTSLVEIGDIARFELKNLTTSVVTTIRCEVVGLSGARLAFDARPLLEAYAGVPSAYRTRFSGITHIKYVPVDDLVVDIPRLQEHIKDPPRKLEENTDFFLLEVGDQKVVRFRDGLFSYLNPPADTYWAEITHLDNRPTIEANFGGLVDFRVEHLATRTENLDYLSAVRGLWWAYFGGPALSKVRTGVQILLGLPFAEADGVITGLEENFSALEGRLIIQDKGNTNIIRTYFYPKIAGLAVNNATGLPYAEGDEVEIFAPLSGGVEVYDWIENPYWIQKYVSQQKYVELDKYFRFIVRADVDTFNLVNLIFAQDFVRKIKPAYTFPLFVMLKNLEAENIDVLDSMTLHPKLRMSDTFCSRYNTGSYRWDDSDESGHWIQQYDDSPRGAQFVFDTHHLLCPGELIRAHVSYIHSGVGGWFFDTLWAYDDGDRDNDGFSDDRIPLQGPDSSPPAPYGPRVYTIHYDATVAAGTYHRERILLSRA